MPANYYISAFSLFSAFQDIHSGCCTVAARAACSADLEHKTFIICRQEVLFTAVDQRVWEDLVSKPLSAAGAGSEPVE